MQLSAISLALTRIYGGGVAPFTPASLFANSEVGAWYDPSDLSTMFQNSAGTTPVTADGQPVGLILDKSQGFVLGTNNVINGDFSAGTAAWNPLVSVLSNVSGTLVVTTNAGSAGGFYQDFGIAANTLISYTFTILSISVGQISLTVGGVSAGDFGVGTHTIVVNTFNTSGIAMYSTAIDCIFSVDNISAKVVAGNHASQATAASRPLYKTDGTYHWLQFDGVDDWLSTAAIDFTSTDKMSVFSGVRIDSATAAGVVCALGSNNDVLGFVHANPWKASSSVSFDLGGNTKNTFRANLPAVPISSVFTFLGDRNGSIAPNGSITTHRRNAANIINDEGAYWVSITGNFGNIPIIIGAINLTGSAIFIGNIYSLIVRGVLSTTQEITDTETWVNGKTGAY